MKNKTLEFFKVLSSIPRESKNESAVADYLVEFAKNHNLKYSRDTYNNVLIKKINSNKKPTILQSHTDMVCVKETDFNFDFSTMPLKLIEKDGYLSAYKTSLGADNGIGVAIILSLLNEDNNFNIEALFTSDEEVTMTGAINFDYSKLNGNKLISLDGFSSTQLTNGCASICDMIISFKNNFIACEKVGYSITVYGLKGGHSGADIHKNIGNAVSILFEILSNFDDVELSSMQGGNQFNFIPNFATAKFAITFLNSEFENKFINNLNNIIKKYKNDYKSVKIDLKKENISKALNKDLSKKIINLLLDIKTGVLFKDNLGGAILSQNLSSVNLEKGIIKISERAHNKQKEDEQIEFLNSLANQNNFSFSIFDRQAGLIPENSTLTKDLCDLNKIVNKENLQVLTQHISVEGAIFKQKKSDLDIVVISPDIYDVHSTKERVYIPSINKTYNLLYRYLENQ